MVANLSEAQKKSIGDRKGNLSSVRQFLAVFKPFPDDGQELSGEALEALREWLQSSGLKEAKRVVEKMAKIGEDEDGYDNTISQSLCDSKRLKITAQHRCKWLECIGILVWQVHLRIVKAVHSKPQVGW